MAVYGSGSADICVCRILVVLCASNVQWWHQLFHMAPAEVARLIVSLPHVCLRSLLCHYPKHACIFCHHTYSIGENGVNVLKGCFHTLKYTVLRNKQTSKQDRNMFLGCASISKISLHPVAHTLCRLASTQLQSLNHTKLGRVWGSFSDIQHGHGWQSDGYIQTNKHVPWLCLHRQAGRQADRQTANKDPPTHTQTKQKHVQVPCCASISTINSSYTLHRVWHLPSFIA